MSGRLKKITADAVAVLTLGAQCWLVTIAAEKLFPSFTSDIAIGVFPVLAGLTVAILHAKEGAVTTAEWGWLALLSCGAGLAFLSIDWAIAFLNGEPNLAHFRGSPLGLPLTILVCPVGTMTCIAGFTRELFMSKMKMVRRRGLADNQSPQ